MRPRMTDSARQRGFPTLGLKRGSPRAMMISLHGYVTANPELGRPDTGGQVVYVLRIAEQLAGLGLPVDIFTRQFEGQPDVEPVSPGVRIVRIPAGDSHLIRKEWMYKVVPEWVENARAWIRRQNLHYDFVSSHYWDAGLAGADLAAQFRIPHVHTPHSLGTWKRDNMQGDPADLEREYNFARRIRDERRVLVGADSVVATSPLQRDLVVGPDYGADGSRVVVLPPGFDDLRFQPVRPPVREQIRRRLGFDRPMVLALGRVAANKGYDLLLRALPTVVERIPNACALLAIGSTSPTPGEVRQVEELRALAQELGLSQHVMFGDYVPDESLADFYRAADVFALSSRYEPFGMTAIEAMACGTPSVITDQGGLYQMLTWGVDSLYADPNDPQAFGHALVSVLRYPDVARSMSESGASTMRKSFTWAAIAQRLLAVTERVVAAQLPTPSSGSRVAARRPESGARESEWLSVGSS